MQESDRKLWQELMKEVMVLCGKIADLNKAVFELWKKVDTKLGDEDHE